MANFLGVEITRELLGGFKGLLLNYKRLNILADAIYLYSTEHPEGTIEEFKAALDGSIDQITMAAGKSPSSPIAEVQPIIAMMSEQVRNIATNV